MPNFLNNLLNRDEELDLEFDLADPESGCFELPPDREDNQVLAVWGSPSSGKTIMSVKIARYIASQKKNVILVLADMSAPPLPFICPPSVACRAKRKKMTSKTQKPRSKIPFIGIKERGFHVKGVFKYIFQP